MTREQCIEHLNNNQITSEMLYEYYLEYKEPNKDTIDYHNFTQLISLYNQTYGINQQRIYNHFMTKYSLNTIKDSDGKIIKIF